MFEEFWKLYPRKIAKKPAQQIWSRLTDDEKLAALQALPNHIRAWDGKEAEYNPHARTWLNQARWTDELGAVNACASVRSAWWTSELGTMAYGRDRGITPRPGEDMAAYRARLRAA
jgi:hypothetical protein